MKKSYVLLIGLLILCCSGTALSQIQLGFLGGLNLANVNSDPEPAESAEIKNLNAFGAGVTIGFKIGPFIVAQIDPMYLIKGYRMEEYSVEADAKIAYIELPLMLKYAFGSGGVRPYIMAGPTIGFNVSAKIKSEGDDISVELDFKDQVKSMDFGLAFGAGLSFPMGKLALFVEGRYGLGLMDISDVDELSDGTIKTKGIQIFTGISMPLGGN